MDMQHRPGGKTGSGGVASWSETNRDRRERLRRPRGHQEALRQPERRAAGARTRAAVVAPPQPQG